MENIKKSRRKIAKIELSFQYPHWAYSVRYRSKTLHIEYAEQNVSGAIERSNQRAAYSRAEKWALSNGFDGFEYK